MAKFTAETARAAQKKSVESRRAHDLMAMDVSESYLDELTTDADGNKITWRERIIMRIREKADKGNLNAAELLFRLAHELDE